MALLTLNEARSWAKEAKTHYARSPGMVKAAAAVLKEQASIPLTEHFDIFLSHSYKDTIDDPVELLVGMKRYLESLNYKVYVDWLVDPKLNRATVTRTTAKTLRTRMDNSDCLFFVTSKNSQESKWMPWELGYMDGTNGRTAILPLA
jgi:hypothetical protein